MATATHRREPYTITVCITDEDTGAPFDLVLTSQHSYHSLRETLRLAWELMGGIPSAWCGIRYRGRIRAELQTNYRGELAEAEISRRVIRPDLPYNQRIVYPLNPAGPVFAGVFAQ